MVFLPGGRIPAGSWLDRWFARRRSAAEFSCGVRVVNGAIDGETAEWSFRPSAVDDLQVDGVLALTHGDVLLRIRLDAAEPTDETPRPGLRVWSASEILSGAQLLLAARPDAFAP